MALLLKHGGDPNAKDSDGVPALVMAADSGHTRTVRAMLQHLVHLDLNASRPDGRTALHRAAYGGQVEAVRVLVQLGADVHAQAADAISSDAASNEHTY